MSKMAQLGGMTVAQIWMEGWATAIVVVMLIITHFIMRTSDKKKPYFMMMNIFAIILFVADILGILYKGQMIRQAYYAVRITNFVIFTMSILLEWTLAKVLHINMIQNGYKGKARGFWLIQIIIAISVILLIVNIFTGQIYYFNVNNLFKQGPYYVPYIYLYLIPLLLNQVLIITQRKYLSRKELISYSSFFLLPLVTTVLSTLVNGMYMINMSIFTSLLIMVFLMAMNDAERITNMQEGIILDFANMVEVRDERSGEHIKRTAVYVEEIAKELHRQRKYPRVITRSAIQRMTKASPLHDIGKIAISDSILNKTSPLTPEESDILKTHTTEGMKLLSKTLMSVGENSYMTDAIDMAWSHHEWWDGTGYPQGLKGEEIPVSARIMAVADCFDELLSKHTYKSARTFDEAIETIKQESGTHFDPLVAGAFLNIAGKFKQNV
ncbi:MAG: HD domain-containing protein [Pseudobutyrivibrio sp.]|nr:HD domain-containing protein [Pseudobutyrivibrio sp.]